MLKAHTFQRSTSTIFGFFFSSASDDINIRQTRWPKGEVDENRVKKSAQAKLTFFVVITDHIIIICGMVYGFARNENKSNEGICSIFHTQSHLDFVEAYISLIETWEST